MEGRKEVAVGPVKTVGNKMEDVNEEARVKFLKSFRKKIDCDRLTEKKKEI